MKWTKVSDKPNKDMMCLVAKQRDDGEIIYDTSYHTIGLRTTPSSPLFIGLAMPNVVAWMPIPEPYTKNKKDWILTTERYPETKGLYLVSIYENGSNREKVAISGYDEKREIFYKSNDVIACMKIPKFSYK